MPVEEKWKANQEKVAYMKKFPGLTLSWNEIQGKTVEAVAPLPAKAGAAVLVFSDGAFAVAPALAPEPWELGGGPTAARRELEPQHRGAYATYDRLVRQDKEALRAARLQKNPGAIQNNLEQILEPKERLRKM